MKIKPEHERNSKISSRGWRALKNWFFIKVTYLAPVIFWSMRSQKIDQKMTEAKRSQNTKNSIFFHAWQPRKGIFEIRSYCGLFLWLFSETLNFFFKIMGPLFKIFFCSNHYIWLVLWVVRCGRKSNNLRATLVLMYFLMNIYFTGISHVPS